LSKNLHLFKSNESRDYDQRLFHFKDKIKVARENVRSDTDNKKDYYSVSSLLENKFKDGLSVEKLNTNPNNLSSF
jgi:hypothetical protein